MVSSSIIKKYRELGILKVYYFSVFFYLLPFLFLALFIIDQLFFNKTEMLFWILFLVGMIPCGLIGLTFSIIGLVKSIKRSEKINKFIGAVGTSAGVVIFFGGLIGLMLIYVVVG